MGSSTMTANLHVEERDGGALAFYLDGDLQFDSADEALYHEGLALPPLCLARPADSKIGLRVLICGGGDGLALREALRFPGVASVDLVDYSPEVVELGRTRFAGLNRNAFADGRVTVHVADAWEFLARAEGKYDVVLCDFTVPRRAEDTRVFTREWYERVRGALAPNGVAGLNAVSPQQCPEAFWCLRRTVRASGLNALPFRVCIPSFRDQGYGAWAFLLASRRKLRRAELQGLSGCPVPTAALDMGRVWHAAEFTDAERKREGRVPVHTLDRPCLLPLLLNPGGTALRADAAGAALPSLDGLLHAIPIFHPYHTRVMVESLAEQVVGTIRALDLTRLLDDVLKRAAELPDDLRRELRRLREYLSVPELPRLEMFGLWAQRLFAMLFLIITVANAVAPDNVFGKGSFGLGHSSVSRGYGGSSHGSFGRNGVSSYGATTSSFGRSGGAAGARGSFGGKSLSGFASGSKGPAAGSFGSKPARGAFAPDAPITGRGFRGSFQKGEPTDIFGTTYKPRTFRYRPYRPGPGGGTDVYVSYHPTTFVYGRSGYTRSSAGSAPVEEQKARFVADDDMLVLDNGDVIITLSDAAYLVVSGGNVALFSNASETPLMALYPDPRLFDNITARLQDQQTAVRKEVEQRKNWLSWVGWTSAMMPAVSADKAELQGLEDLSKRLGTALQRVGASPRNTPPPDLPAGVATDAIELFVSGGLLKDGRVALVDPEGRYLYTDGKTITGGEKPMPCPPEMTNALRSVLEKLGKEFVADLGQVTTDRNSLYNDEVSLKRDLQDYTQLRNANGGSYSVDYGTDEISADEALRRTNADIEQNKKDMADLATYEAKTKEQYARVQMRLATFGR